MTISFSVGTYLREYINKTFPHQRKVRKVRSYTSGSVRIPIAPRRCVIQSRYIRIQRSNSWLFSTWPPTSIDFNIFVITPHERLHFPLFLLLIEFNFQSFFYVSLRLLWPSLVNPKLIDLLCFPDTKNKSIWDWEIAFFRTSFLCHHH